MARVDKDHVVILQVTYSDGSVRPMISNPMTRTEAGKYLRRKAAVGISGVIRTVKNANFDPSDSLIKRAREGRDK